MAATTNLSTSTRPIFLLFDGHAILYRAYYALPPLSDPQGRLVNAVYGFTKIVLRTIDDYRPQYLAVAFDLPAPTFRQQEFKDYKANRPVMPEDLQSQVEIVKQMVAALNIPKFEQAGYEADDLIGSLSCQLDHRPADLGVSDDLLTLIVTGDKDLLQLVDDNTQVLIPGRGKKPTVLYEREQVKEKMGVFPEQVVDLKALMGDSSDNIPGIPGIGPKTAAKLISQFGSLKKLYQVVTKIDSNQSEAKAVADLSPALVTKLLTYHDQAILSQKLAQIDCQVPLKIDLSACRPESYHKDQVLALLAELDFNSLIADLPADEFENQVQQALF